MKLKIKRIDKSLPLPDYEKDAACFDFVCREDVIINPSQLVLVPTNSVIKLPLGYSMLLISRSSTPIKKGLMVANGVGVLDSFFSGDKDEIMIECFNFTDKPVEVKRGERIAQGMIVKFETAEWEEVESMDDRGRGGFAKDLIRPGKR